ncbi:unnamed protein product [Brassica rapa]|uniref:Reverse transcriptase zinc-binding domain-containing protein n=1 Tax=Brassica campestris TaxID=3711 RepID=A0A3P6CS09_BRACM|nr:unnamed protein product [Brassica rapa]VDD12981.1 unnamed protein product [Brassica rapa]
MTKPFKFFNHLTSHPNFLSSTEAAWALARSKASDLSSLGFKLKNIKCPLKTLHKDNFSDIQKECVRLTSIWSLWFREEILGGNIETFWVINTRQKHSWLINKLLDARENVYPWIRKQVHNGETTYFWSTNWLPFGKLTDYLQASTSTRFPVSKNSTLAELLENGDWILPNARSNRQLQVISYLSTMVLDDSGEVHEW